MTEPIELYDVQGNILNGYGTSFGHAAYLFLHAGSTESARRCLGDVADRVTTAVPWPGGPPRTTLNVAVTFAGFARLGLPVALLGRFPAVFRESTRDRAPLLGDIGPSSPQHWVPALGTGEAHFLLTVYARSRPELTDAVAGLRDLTAAPGADITIVHQREARAMARQREHFGYADGFSQPDIEGVQRLTSSRKATTRGHGVPLDDLGWRPLKVGEFLLGYADEDGYVDTAPEPGLVRNGTYVVYRELRQDVARFRQGLRQAATVCGLPEELVAAKVVGRWRDGTPLELSPDHDAGDLTDEAVEDPSNDFRYLPHDLVGYTCPAGAHVRRANPRDALRFGGRLAARHRIIRRGMPYGEPLAPGAEDDEDRGLVFVCFNADTERQFETIQARWCNDGDAFGLGDDRDYLLGDTGGTGKMTIPLRGQAPRFIEAQPEIVLTRGAEYLLAPGIRALHRLAAGAVG
jgi:Dyp-type peroxidase family